MKVSLEAPSKDLIENAIHLAQRTEARAARNQTDERIAKIHKELAQTYTEIARTIQITK